MDGRPRHFSRREQEHRIFAIGAFSRRVVTKEEGSSANHAATAIFQTASFCQKGVRPGNQEMRKPEQRDTGIGGNDPIRLADAEPFGRGGNRLCFVDPRDAYRCIKVPIPGREAKVKRAAATGWKRLRPVRHYDDNLREYASYRRIASHFGAAVWTHLPRCHGLVATDLGQGILTDLIRDPSGRVSVSLKTILREEGRGPYFQAGLDDFVAYLRDTCLPTRDLLLHNLVAQWDESRSRLRFYVVDGFGSSDALPLVYWSRRLARAKVERKIARFHGKIDEFCQKYSIGVEA